VYFNSGDSPSEIWADAKAQGEKEKSQWPYPWMQHPDYPLERAQVSGTLLVGPEHTPARHALVLLTAPEPNWQLQVLNYIFSTRTDSEGRFLLPHVRPGSYTFFAMVPGITDEFRQDRVKVTANGSVDLGAVTVTPATYSIKLWEIGYADRTTAGFRLSDEPRQYGLEKKVPANLTYTIGESTPERDWYYAQAKRGDWTIVFKTERAYKGDAVLTIGIAGQTSNPAMEVLVNDKRVGTYAGYNSSAGYRSAILGSSHYEKKTFRFPASLLHTGRNTVTLGLSKGSIMYDVLKLEIDEPTK
jgi:rhamnogalacturonan endolyase